MRKASRAEWLLAGFFLLHMALIVLQQYADLGMWIFDPRYHAPSYPILFGWTAYPLVLLIRRFKWTIPIFILALVVMIYRVPRAQNAMRKDRREMMAMSARVAEVIRRDWNGPTRAPAPFSQAEYRASRAPIIAAQPMITYLTKGRQAVGESITWWKRPYEEWVDKPDYICLSNGHYLNPDFAMPVRVCETEDYELVEELRSGRTFFTRIYRKRRP